MLDIADLVLSMSAHTPAFFVEINLLQLKSGASNSWQTVKNRGNGVGWNICTLQSIPSLKMVIRIFIQGSKS